jgi:hypothetical protein
MKYTLTGCTLSATEPIPYKGQILVDTGYFYAPHWPGISDEDRARVDADIAFRNRPTTQLQHNIMDMVRTQTVGEFK